MDNRLKVAVPMLTLLLSWVLSLPVAADDLTGAARLLCTPTEATVCALDGECETAGPRQFNIPAFIEVDLEAKLLKTTEASAENRQTPIFSLSRDNGLIVLQGFENERAFSFSIEEATGLLTAAVARPGVFVGAFGACTPLSSDDD